MARYWRKRNLSCLIHPEFHRKKIDYFFSRNIMYVYSQSFAYSKLVKSPDCCGLQKMRYGPPFKTSSEMAWLTLKTALHGKKELLDVSFSCQGTTRYHSLSWHFLILVLALFDRKVKMQPGINSENMIHSL